MISKKYVYIYILVFFQFLFLNIAFTQNKKIEIETGVRFRITPVYLKGYQTFTSNPRSLLLQQDPHISGSSFMAGLNYFIGEKIYLNYQAFIRYDEFILEIGNDGTPVSTTPSKKIFLDHQLSLLYTLLNNPKLKISSGIGYSYNNLNSEYSYSYEQINPSNGEIEVISGIDNYKFSTFDLPIDFIFNDKLILGLKNSITARHRFLDPSELFLFSLSARYKFGL